ncbi:hypothetical protein ANCDUO_18151 [Ancylostoma duodenale]|uniref:Reverse transcriptase RNase H-like domain-containing protein n=1 Tax=Ancylostoma duodenale TaxID=51022 RepID=A0A0C2FT31_9BILA|nr:hypothetical protein ANCDUO_18151 [Ancylostoma duodenale]
MKSRSTQAKANYSKNTQLNETATSKIHEVICALDRFHHFVYEVGTVFRTDNSPLTTLFTKVNVLPTQECALKIQFVKGTANIVVDAPSRDIVETTAEQPTHEKN